MTPAFLLFFTQLEGRTEDRRYSSRRPLAGVRASSTLWEGLVALRRYDVQSHSTDTCSKGQRPRSPHKPPVSLVLGPIPCDSLTLLAGAPSGDLEQQRPLVGPLPPDTEDKERSPPQPCE